MLLEPEHFRAFTRGVVAFCLFVMILLGFFEILPLYTDYPEYINQVELQRARAEVIATDLVILARLPQDEHPEALASLEVALPLFKQEQSLLTQDQSSDIESLVQQSQSGYLALSMAAQNIISSPDKHIVDSQISIVAEKRDEYRHYITQIINTLISHSNMRTMVVFGIKSGIVSLLFIVSIVYFIIFERRMAKVIANEKASKPAS